MLTHFKLFTALFLCSSPLAFLQALPSSYSHQIGRNKLKIAINNIPLAKVNGNVISLADVVKELDFRLYTNNPNAYQDPQQRFAFYREGWRRQLEELVHLELLKKEAEEKKMQISDADVRQELMNRYGSDLLEKLHEAHLTFEDAKTSIKNDLLTQQMNWFGFVNKAFYKIGPQMLKTAYEEHIVHNPPNEFWKYQFLTVRLKDKGVADQLAFKLKAIDSRNFSNLFALKESVQSLLPTENDARISISDDFNIEDRSISSTHKTVLSQLPTETLSEATFQQQNGEYIIRVFHLKDRIKTEVEPFHQMSERLKGELISKMAEKERLAYFQRLKEKSGYTDQQIYFKLPADYEPFSLKESV